MKRELPPYRAAVTKTERTGIWPTVLIGAVLAFVIVAGLKLYSQTRNSWENNRRPSKNQQISARVEREQQAERERNEILGRIRQQRAEATRQREQSAISKQSKEYESLRCINGQLFRRLPNGWENLPGKRC